MTDKNPKLDLVNINVHTKFVKFYQLVLKILGGNEILKVILTSVKGWNSVTNVEKWYLTIMFLKGYPNLALVNINAILQLCS